MKRGQMKISFGMIFSIILIIAFIVFAFYAVRALMRTQDQIKIGGFVDGLQSDVDKIWRASQAKQKVSYILPKKVEKICFVDHLDFGENLILVPNDFDFPPIQIGHINLTKIIGNSQQGEFCINTNGKAEMNLTKEHNEDLVTIKR